MKYKERWDWHSSIPMIVRGMYDKLARIMNLDGLENVNSGRLILRMNDLVKATEELKETSPIYEAIFDRLDREKEGIMQRHKGISEKYREVIKKHGLKEHEFDLSRSIQRTILLGTSAQFHQLMRMLDSVPPTNENGLLTEARKQGVFILHPLSDQPTIGEKEI